MTKSYTFQSWLSYLGMGRGDLSTYIITKTSEPSLDSQLIICANANIAALDSGINMHSTNYRVLP